MFATQATPICSIWSVSLCEAIGLREALISMIKAMGFQKIQIEMDALTVVTLDCYYFGLIVSYCKALLHKLVNCTVSFGWIKSPSSCILDVLGVVSLPIKSFFFLKKK